MGDARRSVGFRLVEPPAIALLRAHRSSEFGKTARGLRQRIPICRLRGRDPDRRQPAADTMRPKRRDCPCADIGPTIASDMQTKPWELSYDSSAR
jgi:hypothetical protein